jgi:hypothetical protein
MVSHFFGLVAQAISKMPALVGSNWGGLIFPAAVFTLTQIVLAVMGEVKKHWQRNVVIGFAVAGVAWTGLFLLSTVLTVYDDHQNMVGATNRIKHALQDSKRLEASRCEGEKRGVGEQLISSRILSSSLEGKNQVLDKQNRDEQTLIAGCQNQALKLLVPEALKITPVVFDSENDNVATRVIRWLLLTNKELPPHLNIVCGEGMTYIQSASLRIVGGAGAFFGGVSGRLGPTAWELSQGSGAWSPGNPLLITISYRGSENAVCSFIPR